MQYVVRRAFTYAGQDFPQGTSWEPAGHRNDAAIIRTGMVIVPKGVAHPAPAPVDATPARSRRAAPAEVSS